MNTISLPKKPFPLDGSVKKGYEPVLDTFIANIESGQEVGASFTVFHKGEKVIDLWGGYANKDTQEAWQEDTLSIVFSVTKGIASLSLLMLADRGLLDYKQKVAHYWPEFAQNGKADISVKQLLNHTSGLMGLDKIISLKAITSKEGKQRLKEALEQQKPYFTPGIEQGYHAITFGMYAAELFKQVSGEDMLDFFEREIKPATQADIWIGNADTQQHRISKLCQLPLKDRIGTLVRDLILGGTTEANVVRDFIKPKSVVRKAFLHTPTSTKGAMDYADELGQTNAFWWASAFSNGRGLAQLYMPLSMGGSTDTIPLVSKQTLDMITPIEHWSQQDRVLGKPVGWNRGFLKEAPHIFSPNPECFGHPGMGGALGWADPVEKISIGYAMNCLDFRIRSPRCVKLCKALYESPAIFS